MTLDEFWHHIAETQFADPDTHANNLSDRLAKLSPEDIVDFDYWWNVLHTEAYSRDLWAAAYYANGGCSDDGFIDFRNWLILRGRDAFYAVVSDPNALVDYVQGGTADCEFMCECYVAGDAWERGVGDDFDAYRALYAERHPVPIPVPELGENWDFEDPAQIRLRLPRFCHDESDPEGDP